MKTENQKLKDVIIHSLTNGSALMIIGSLVIGFIADTKQAEGIKPFTNIIFKGFLSIFLLEMGMVTARRLIAFRKKGLFITMFAIVILLLNGCMVAFLSQFFLGKYWQQISALNFSGKCFLYRCSSCNENFSTSS